MPDRITLQIARYRPEQDSSVTFDEHEVPCPKDWVVLDGLNHIKDHLDGTLVVPVVVPDGYLRKLRDDRERRTQADVRHLPRRLRARPDPHRAAPQLSRHPRPHRRHRRLHAEAGTGDAVAGSRRRHAGCRGRVPADAGAAGRVQAVQHVHQLHAVLRGVPDLRPRSKVHRAGGDCAGAALQPRQPRRGGVASAWRCSRSTRASGGARSSASARRSARRTWILPARSSVTS